MTIYHRLDGTMWYMDGALPRGVGDGPDYEHIRVYLAEHPEALVPEPAPPEPSPEELAAASRSRALADLAELDARAIRPLRAIAAGTATDVDRAELGRIEAESAELRKGL